MLLYKLTQPNLQFTKTTNKSNRIMLSTSSLLQYTSSPLAGNRYSGITTSSPSPSNPKFRPTRISAVTSTSSPEKTRSPSSSSPSCYLDMTSSSSFLSLYEVLGVSMGATSQEIKSSYRRLARVFHPDAAAATTADPSDTSSADAFIKIHAAYSTLSDPSKRFIYDRDLIRRQRRFVSYSGLSSAAMPGGSKSSYNVRRNWETDQCW